MGTLSGLIPAYQGRGAWICWHFESQIYKVCVPSYPESLILSFFPVFGHVICVLLQSFFLLYQLSVLKTTFWGLSGNLFTFRWSLFLCMCFCYFHDSCHWNWLTWLGMQFFFPWVIMCMWFEAYNLVIFLNWRGTSNLSSLFSYLLHDLKDGAWATTRTAKWADRFAVPVFTMAYFRKTMPYSLLPSLTSLCLFSAKGTSAQFAYSKFVHLILVMTGKHNRASLLHNIRPSCQLCSHK